MRLPSAGIDSIATGRAGRGGTRKQVSRLTYTSRTLTIAGWESAGLEQTPFVGRDREMRQLQAAYEGAAAGQGALVTVVGEPGIGKTALCEQLVRHVVDAGGLALVGHCYEEGSLSLPYLPFIEALRAHIRVHDPDLLRAELGSG